MLYRLIINRWSIVLFNLFLAFTLGSFPNLILAMIFLFIELVIQPWLNGDYNKKGTEMTPLEINDEVREQIKRLIQVAENNVVKIYELTKDGKLNPGDVNPIGDNSAHTITIPHGFKVVYSIEDQGEGTTPDGKLLLGKCKHFSMSVMNNTNTVPTPQSVDMVIKEFGFSPLYKCICWTEAPGNGVTAINVLEPVDGFSEEILKDIGSVFDENLKQMIDQMRKIE